MIDLLLSRPEERMVSGHITGNDFDPFTFSTLNLGWIGVFVAQTFYRVSIFVAAHFVMIAAALALAQY